MEFNKQIFFNNITYTLKKREMKIGELEAAANVSPGYISRASKDSNSKPGIDFVMKAAEALNLNVDILLKADLARLNPTEEYLMSFITKLTADTVADELEWQCEQPDLLNDNGDGMSFRGYHPLFSAEGFFEEGESGYPEYLERTIFVSRSFGVHTYINDNCYNLKMKNGAILYLMSISKSVHRVNDKSAYAKEMWICTGNTPSQFLCSNKDDSLLAELLDHLYETVDENAKHPKVRKDVKYIIDAYMNGDIGDEKDDSLPLPNWQYDL